MSKPDQKPPNLYFSDESYFYKAVTWWDIGECGTMIVFYYRDNYPHDINFNIYSLLTHPYSALHKPYAELHKKGNMSERTLDINAAEVDMHGWVTFEGEVTIDIPKWHTVENMVSTNWRDVETFASEFKAIVKRIIYEAVEINSQIAEESNFSNIDFEKENPYTNVDNVKIIKNTSKKSEDAEKEKSSSWGCFILIILILLVWMFLK